MSAVYNSTVQGFYLSYYGRPADPAGLTFWTGQLAAAGGNLSAILNAFGTSAEATRRYGTGTTESKIQAVYQQTFGRAADAAGLAFYNTEITAGRITLIDMSKRIIDGATGDDVSIRNNRLSAAQSFTDKLDTDAEKAGYSGSGAEDAARAWVATVTKDAATVTAAVATADSTITSLLPQAFALTVNQDKWTGSAGNDSATGSTSSLASSDTLGITDQIDGGDGSDTLSLTMGKSFAGFQTNTGWLKNTETVNLTNSTGTVYSFAAKGVSGVTQYNVTGAVDVTSIDSLSTKVLLKDVVNLANATASAVTVSFADALVSGSNDSASLSINTLGRASSSTTDPFDFGTGTGSSINLTVPAIENLSIDATGSNFLSFAGSTSLKSLTVTGSGNLLIDGVTPDALRTVDASAIKGVSQLDLAGRTASNLLTSVKTGDGNDTIVIDTTSLRADAAVSGGSGTDTLRINNAANNFGPTAFSMSGIEVLRLSGTTGTHDISASGTSGLATIRVDARQDGNVSVTGIGANDITVELNKGSSDTEADSVVTVENTAKATVLLSGGSSASSSTLTDNVSLTKATSVVLDVPQFHVFQPAAAVGGVDAALATSVTVKGDGQVSDAWTSNTNAGLIIPRATSLTIDQSSTTAGAWTVGVVSNTTTPVLTTLNVTTKSTNGITLSSDVVGNVDAFENLERVTVDTATHFNFADGAAAAYALPKATAITLGGTASASQVTLGAIGADTMAYGLSVTATGLRGNLTLGNLKVGGGQSITVDLTGMSEASGTTTTDLTIGGLQESSASTNVLTGAVTLNAKNTVSEGSFKIAESAGIWAKTVTLDLSGSSAGTGSSDVLHVAHNNTTAQTITGETVVVRTPAAPTTYYVGDFSVGSSLTYVGPTTVKASNSGGIKIATTGSSFTADLTTGLGADDFTITGGATTATYVVKGDLKDGTDSVTITAAAKSGSTGVSIDVKDLVSAAATVTGSANADTIVGSASGDTIRGGNGADTLTGGGGKDTFLYQSSASELGSAALTSTAVTRSGNPVDITNVSYVVTANDFISTSGIDKILDFSASDGDVINLQSRAAPAQITLQTFGQILGTGKSLSSSLSGQSTTAITKLANNSYDVYITGNYDASNNRFTFSQDGTSTLYVIDYERDADATDLYAIVLVGYTGGGTIGSTGASAGSLIG